MLGEGQLFQPDTLLPSQFFGAMRRRVPREPEYRLIVAVLQDGIECFQKYMFARDHKARRLFEDAHDWISSDDRQWPFSFVNICEVLNLDPEFLRQGLQTWQEQQLAARPRARVLELNRVGVSKIGERRDLTAEAS